MKVIIDTNVLVSAIIRDQIPEKVVIGIIDSPIFDWVASQEIINEYIEVLKRPKFKLNDNLLVQWLNLFKKTITIVESKELIDYKRDRKDSKFLSCAKFNNVDILITGDGDFSEAQLLVDTKIVSVRDFYNVFIETKI